MELEGNHTKSPLDWLGDITTVVIMLPVILIALACTFLYYGVMFPFWWLKRKMRK